MFDGQIEECFVLAIVDLRNPYPASETGLPCVVWLGCYGLAACIIKETVRIPRGSAQMTVGAAVITVRA